MVGFYNEHDRRASGESQFAHIARVSEIIRLASPTKTLSEGLELAVKIHDMVDRSLYNQDTAIRRDNTEMLTYILKETAKTNPRMAAYSYGIAYSACQYQEAAMHWRDNLSRAISEQKDNSLAFLNNQISLLDAEDGENNLPQKLKIALNGDSRLPIDNEVKSFVSPVADIEEMIRKHELYDIEGLVLASADVMDNLRHPNPNRPASAWKDTQELLSYLGPLLEIAGLNELARECYSTAYESIFEQSPFMPRAREIHEQATLLASDPEYQLHIPDLAVSIIRYALGQLGKSTDLVINSRVKKPGSIANKFSKKPEYAFLGNVSDDIGYRAEVLDDSLTAYELMNIAEQVVVGLLQANPNLVAAHIKPTEPAIDANYQGLEESKKIIRKNKQRIQISTGGARRTGYEAVHMSFMYSANNEQTRNPRKAVSIEIQLLKQKEHIENTYGIASHLFYKLREGFGKVGQKCREFFANPAAHKAEFQEMVAHLRNDFQRIYNRAAYFQENINMRDSTEFKLTPNVIEVVKEKFTKMGIALPDAVLASLALEEEHNAYIQEP